MKRLEIIFGFIFLLGNTMKLLDIPGYFLLIKFSSMLLCIVYFFFSYVLLNPMKIEDSNTHFVGVYRTLMSILIGWALCTFVFGIYSIVTFLFAGWIFSIIGFVWLIVCCVILLFGKKRYKVFVVSCYKRIFIVVCVGGIAIIETILLASR